MMDFKINHGLVAYLPYKDSDGETPILHFCGYENTPTQSDINSLRKELSEDREFGLTEIANDLIIELAHENITKYYNEKCNKNSRFIRIHRRPN